MRSVVPVSRTVSRSKRTHKARKQLATWAAAARSGLSSNTLRAYRIDSAAFAAWGKAHRLVTAPASPETVAAFLKDESTAGKAVATIRRRLATIARMHKAAGFKNPCEHELVRLAMKGIARDRGTDQKQAAALTARDADTIRARMGTSMKDSRDLAMMLTGRDLLSRASELVALRVEDVTPTENGAEVRLRRKKTSTETREYFIGAEAAQALADWLARSGITAGPIFCTVIKGGRVSARALGTRDVSRTLKAIATGARLKNAATISGHSLRVGMACDLVAANLDVASVMQAGGWASARMIARYTEKLSAKRGAVAQFYAKR